MELRKSEQELTSLVSEWKALRRRSPCYGCRNGAASVSLLETLPSWRELRLKIDDSIFPSLDHIEEAPAEQPIVELKETTNNESSAEAKENGVEAEDEPGYSEWGMLMTGSTTMTEPPKVEPIQQASTNNQKAEAVVVEADEEMDEEDETIVNAPPPEILSGFVSLQKNLELLRPKIDKFMTRLTERDPITKKPRYGEKAIIRVKKIIRMYKALEHGVSTAFVENGVVTVLKDQIKHHEDQIKAREQAILTTQQLEAQRIEKERLAAEQAAKEQRLKEEEEKRKETEELAAGAAESRMRRMQEEQATIDAEAESDRALLALVPVKGVEGVKMQIDRMRDALKDNKKALDVALGSLYTLFDQIVRKPEEVNYRRIRRDHPKFMEDIGRYVGGREVLIAAGFKLEKLDGVPCFFSKEPHIESDMDGWSEWFDGLKKTLDVIEEEMIK